jgi:DNA-directed RNA polymerase specialized sigma24 family protein
MMAAKFDTYVVELPERMMAGEEIAYGEFADEFGGRLRKYFIRKGLPVTEAEDLADGCIAQAALRISQYRNVPGIAFSAWVYGIGRHALADWRERFHETEPFSDDIPAQSLFSGDVDGDIQIALAVRKGLAKLSAAERTIIRLRDMTDGWDFAAIGKKIGTSAGAARVRHLRALRRLERILGADSCIRAHLERSERRLKGYHE